MGSKQLRFPWAPEIGMPEKWEIQNPTKGEPDMNRGPSKQTWFDPEREEWVEEPTGPGDFTRREFVELVGAGLLITVAGGAALGQRRGGRGGFGGGRPLAIAARLHIAPDGTITVLTGKVEVGQGSRAELTQAAAEELCVAPQRIRLVMGDTDLVPDDGITAGSRTTPFTVPALRQGAAAARRLLTALASKRWQVEPAAVDVQDGTVVHASSGRKMTYGELAATEDLVKEFAATIPSNIELTPTKGWKVMGTSLARPNLRDLVTGAHRFPSDIVRPGMLYGKVLRAPSYGAKLMSVDLGPAKAMEGVQVVREGDFVGCVAPTALAAQRAVDAIAQTASWQPAPHPSSRELFTYLKEHAQFRGGSRGEESSAKAATVLRATYHTAYIQHAPMEPRAATAEWTGGKLTVWTGSQGPFGVLGELTRALDLPRQRVRVIVPDTGCGFGGKHNGDAAIEAARLACAVGRPVAVHWTREEEFTWACFRPAALMELEAGLDARGRLVTWDHVNINAGGAAVDSPYAIPGKRSRSVSSEPPLRQSSYRALAATANNFARESFMDELAAAAGADPLAFRLAHLEDERLRAVLELATKKFAWADRIARRREGIGIGLACGTEKGSFVAACVEVAADRRRGQIKVLQVCEAFEPGAIVNPVNLREQVEGCIIMGLGGALTEEIRFENGKILNPHFSAYRVPHFEDVPPIEIHLLNRPDLPSAGGGETPIIAIAPAIANAVFQATGVRLRALPLRGSDLRRA